VLINDQFLARPLPNPVALQKLASVLIRKELPLPLSLKPPGRAVKPLILVPAVPGSHPKPEPEGLFVTADFNTVPAVVL
jgi:hypothetical protein